MSKSTNNATNGKKVHRLRVLGSGAYPACHPGLLVGTPRGQIVTFYGDWSYASSESVVDCDKCVKLIDKGR